MDVPIAAPVRVAGGKGAPGVAARIIAEMPPHEYYLEPFAGSAAVYRTKRPAAHSLLIERDPATANALRSIVKNGDAAGGALTVWCGDARELLAGWKWAPGQVVYFDPPYLKASRRATRAIYRHEITEVREHQALIQWARSIAADGAAVLYSHYRCPLYDEGLSDWRRIDIPTMTRGGPAVESVWLSFAPTEHRHDTRFAGANYRERERIKRKSARWRARFAAMSVEERAAVRAALAAVDGAKALP